jgi:tetratricopeptide (TPR) repeat protein
LLADGYARLPEQPAVNTSNATALLSLAQAYVATGEHVKAVEVLEQAVIGPITLLNANHQSVQNPLFIEETYRTALQAYVGSLGAGGAAMMEKAKIAMAAMQQAVGSDAAGKQRMLGIYVNLAQNVENQMTSASLEAKQEMSKVFEAFLQELSAGSSDVGVLNWVAETFASLGAGFDDDPDVLNEDARKYYARSIAAFQNILSKTDLQPQLVTQMTVRMASVKSQMHEYQAAMTHLEEVLGKTPNAINVQVEAAQLLQRWSQVEPAKYQQAIAGIQGGAVWGWGMIANKTMQYKQFRDTFYQARYQMAQCQFQLAQTKQGEARKKLLAVARRGITRTKQLYPTLGGEKWTRLYDELLKNVGP